MWLPCSVRELTSEEAEAARSCMAPHVLQKAKETGGKPRFKLVGIASAQNPDLEGDTIVQDGLNWKNFLARGFINDDHRGGAANVLGYPTKVMKTTVKVDGRTFPATAVEGYLFDVPHACALAQLAMAMEGTDRQMGLSVEGPPPTRSPQDRRRIERADVNHLALTPWPVNPAATAQISLVKSFARLAKGMVAGYPGDSGPGTMRPLMPESLGVGLPVLGLDFDALKSLSENWMPDPGVRLTKRQAERLIRAQRPDAAPLEVARILEASR